MSMPGLDFSRRASGVLLHPSALPGPFGVGDLGPDARRFADFLHSAGQLVWQMLPVGPVGYGNSPYSAHSAFAGSPLLVSLEDLVRDRLLTPGDLETEARLPVERADYASAGRYRDSRLRAAYARFPAVRRDQAALRADYEAFSDSAKPWLGDFTLYAAIKHQLGATAWTTWPRELVKRDPRALEKTRADLADEIEYVRFQQWLFDRQWRALRDHCRGHGIALLGDVPIYVAGDSADVWADRRWFRVDAGGRPEAVAGVPPDYFSSDGQLWGNPLYDWEALAQTGYRWWIDRISAALSRFDGLRLDHFIGFERIWEVPASARRAAEGRYVKGPGERLFAALREALGSLPLVAEDLGVVTPEVRALRSRLGLPGIVVLQFAFGSDPCAPDFKPHNYQPLTLACTGTHDNDTTAGWFHERGGEASTRSAAQCEGERRAALDYLGAGQEAGAAIHWHFIRLLLSSVAKLAIIPMQDLLGLGTEARMNRPGSLAGNWEWRLAPGAAKPELADRLRRLCEVYERLPPRAPPGARPEGR